MRLFTRHPSNARAKAPEKQMTDTHVTNDTQYVSYNIDDYGKLLSTALASDEVSRLELKPSALLNTIANSANYVMDQVSDLTSGPFPTTNNVGKMNPFISALQQQVNAINNPQATAMMTPEMIHAQNAPLTLTPPPQQPLPTLMMPQVGQPQMAAMVPPPVAAAVTAPAPPAFVPTIDPQQRMQEVSQNINETLAKAYVTPRIPERIVPHVRYEYITGVMVIVMVVIFFMAGCIYRIKQRRKKNAKKV